ncbi:hypothetical protein GCM10027347_45100 [Larkinella harenae]
MKTLKITVATLVTLGILSFQAQAQTTTKEGNAANPAQSNTSNSNESTTDAAKTRPGVSRKVTGSRPPVNSMSDKSQNKAQMDREKRAPSDADGKVSTNRGRPKADPKAKQKKGEGRSFGNTAPEN